MKDEGRAAPILFESPPVNGDRVPVLQALGLAGGQARPHGKVSPRQI